VFRASLFLARRCRWARIEIGAAAELIAVVSDRHIPDGFFDSEYPERDNHTVQLKLDELIRAVSGAHNALLDLEKLEEADLERVRARHEEFARTARKARRRGELDTGTPELKPD